MGGARQFSFFSQPQVLYFLNKMLLCGFVTMFAAYRDGGGAAGINAFIFGLDDCIPEIEYPVWSSELRKCPR
jgi:hypothetical protein